MNETVTAPVSPTRVLRRLRLCCLLGGAAEIEQAGGVRDWKQQLDYEPGREAKAWLWLDDMADFDTGEIPATIVAYGA